MKERIKEIREKAKRATKKPATYGTDIDIEAFEAKAEELPSLEDLTHLPHEEKENILKAGIDPTEEQRGGSFLQIDHSVVHYRVKEEGVEILSTAEAFKKYDWLLDYWWQAVPVDTDKYTARVELHQEHGYFIRVLPGVKTIYPLQACLYLSQEHISQDVHNVIICEEGSELHIITGCATSHRVISGLHLGVSEFYIKKGATCTFTMIHNWAEEMRVRPRTGIMVEEGGTFISNYLCLKPVKDLQMYPTAYLGPNATARFSSVLVASPDCIMDVGSRVFLRGEGSRAEVISRAITTGGKIIARGYLIGESPNIKAHLECKGLMLSEKGIIHAIPELEGQVSGVEMSHEAAVGKIAQEQIEYLMARGLSEEEATALIVRGFLRIDIKGLPAELKAELDKAIEATEKDVF